MTDFWTILSAISLVIISASALSIARSLGEFLQEILQEIKRKKR